MAKSGRVGRTPRGTFHSFIMFTLLNLILLAHEFCRNLVVAYADESEAGIELTRFQVPAHVKPGELRRLTCQFKLYGATLHAMKLFKDDQEFFRFTPTHQKMTFPVVGVHVDLNRSKEGEVWLKINKRSSGQYKCQVLIEGTFKSVSLAKRMEVVQADIGLASPGSSSGAWQHHPTGQQQDTNTRPHLGSQPHSAVQQHPSHLYGLSTGGGGSSGGPASLLLVLIWSLLVGTILATTIMATSASLTIRLQETSSGQLEGHPERRRA